MWKVSDIVCLIFIISSFKFCCATQLRSDASNNDTLLKMSLVEDIVRKVCNLSLDTFSNKSPAEKIELMTKIEKKLNESARALGAHGSKYIKLIMKGVQSKAFDNQVANSKKLATNAIVAKARIDKKEPEKNTIILSKEKLIENITRKIEYLAKSYLRQANAQEKHRIAVENIKEIVRLVSRNHTKIHNKPEDIKTYVDLIAKGIDAMMRKQTKTDNNKRRNMEIVYIKKINLINDARKRYLGLNEPITRNASKSNVLEYTASNLSNKPKSVQINKNTNLDFTLKTSSIETSCDDAVEETCRKIKLVKMFQCLSDNANISILKLCDGVGDCLDFSDEKQCALNAVGSIKSANRLMTYINSSLSQNCYSDLVDESIIKKQHKILSDVLHNQLTFLHKYSTEGSLTSNSRRIFTTNIDLVTKTVNEAVNIVDSLSSALNSSLCSTSAKNYKTRRESDDVHNNSIQLTGALETSTWTPEVCKCNGKNCITVCSSNCGKICWNKYSLSQLQCSAVTGEKLVSLDMICDGKPDCYDESDEKYCSRDISLAKFEATEMYNDILNMISLKAASKVQKSIRNMLINLNALVTKLHRLSLKRHASILELKPIRDAAFSALSSIYEASLRYAQSPKDLDENYEYLRSLNVKLVNALKRSNAGNDRIISTDGCVCRGIQCALPRCSRSCSRACAAEPKLTRYFCDGSFEQNNSVPIEDICNSKKDCPNEDDEKDCKKDVCRAFHLKLLRHNIRDVGKIQLGTALGEALNSWRAKVTSTLMLAENNNRSTPAMIREIVHDMLHDLVMAYATIEVNRRSDSNTIFEEFYTLSRVVINTLKSCGQ